MALRFKHEINTLHTPFQHKPLLFIILKINDVPTVCLLDSGATCSVIRSDFHDLSFQPCSTQFTSLQGDVDINKSTYATLTIGTTSFSHFMYVLDNMKRPVILGSDFLTRYKPTLNFSNMCITFPSHDSLPMYFNEESAYHSLSKAVNDSPNIKTTGIPVRLSQNSLVQPHSYTTTPVTYDSQVTNEAYLFEPSLNFVHKKCGILPSILIQGNEMHHIPILNILEIPQNYIAGTCIGHLYKADEIYAFDHASETVLHNTNHIESPRSVKLLTDDELFSLKVNPVLNESEKQKMHNLLRSYGDVFSFTSTDLGCYTGPYPLGKKVHIHTEHDHPIQIKPFKHSMQERMAIDAEVKKLLEMGIIRRSNSSWSAPVLLVKRKDDPTRPRLCVSYVALNKIVPDDKFPLPPIEDIFQILKDCQYFTVADIASGFHQLELDEESIPKTAFSTHNDHYEYLRLPFGLKSSPAVFARLMKFLFDGMLYKGLYIYMDDLILYSKTYDEHLTLLKQVFDKLRAVNLTLRATKCRFAFHEVAMLGYVVNKDGIKPNPVNIKAIKNMPVPYTAKLVKSFLGLCSFYRRFVKGFSEIAHPLNDLTKDGVPFIWTNECDIAFNTLKEKLMSPPILTQYDPSKEVEIHSDSSLYSLGAILMQRDSNNNPRVLSYASRVLNAAERNYSTTHKECLAAIWAVNLWRPYTYGNKVKLLVDHHSLCSILKMSTPRNSRLARWVSTLSDVNFSIHYVRGSLHKPADCMSRLVSLDNPNMTKEGQDKISDILKPNSEAIFQFEHDNYRHSFHKAQLEDPYLSPIYVNTNAAIDHYAYPFRIINNILYYCRANTLRLAIPSSYKANILSAYHDAPSSSHNGIHRTYYKIKKRFYWHNMYDDICTYINSCTSCAANKPYHHKKAGFLIPHELPRPFTKLYIDYIGPLTTSIPGQYNHIAVAVDSATRFVIAEPIRNPTARILAGFILNKIIHVHGMPRELVFDNQSCNRSALIQELCKAIGTSPIFTSPYSKSGNAPVERMNQTIEHALKHYVSQKANDWAVYLPACIFGINTAKHSGSESTAFYLCYGRDPVFPRDISLPLLHDYNAKHLATIQNVRENASALMMRHQDATTDEYNKKHMDNTFQVNDRVYVSFPNLALAGASAKLSAFYSGPFTVVELLPHHNLFVKSDHPNSVPIRTHVNRLKPFTERPASLKVQQTDEFSPFSNSLNTEVSQSDSSQSPLNLPNQYVTRSGRVIRPPKK